MLRSILIGLDGSAYCSAAVEWGARKARSSDITLLGLGIIDAPTICAGEPVPLGGMVYKEHSEQSRLKEARGKVSQFLQQFAQRCQEAGVCHAEKQVEGHPYEEIALEAQRHDLVVVGQQTFFHFETQNKPGHTLDQVLKWSPRPVVAAPRVLWDGSGVVVAYDGSVQASRALQLFQSLELHESQVVHVVSVDSDAETARRHAELAVEFLRARGVDAQPIPLTSSSLPHELILDQVDRLKPSLLVMGAYGKRTFRELVFGSVTRKVLGHSPVPVFLYH